MDTQAISSFLFIFIIYGLIIVFGVTYIIESGVNEFINESSHLWYWCTINILLYTLLLVNLTVNFTYNLYNKINFIETTTNNKRLLFVKMFNNKNWIYKILSIISLGITIWGCIIYSQIKNNNIYPKNLWIWFMVVLIYELINWSAVVVIICYSIYEIIYRNKFTIENEQ